jgi:hypothetical protein
MVYFIYSYGLLSEGICCDGTFILLIAVFDTTTGMNADFPMGTALLFCHF